MADWLNTLDIPVAWANCRKDVYGDWYRDPWDWPELNWAATQGIDHLVQRLNSAATGRAALLDVAKENFILRPAVVLDPVDRLAYEALVDHISPQVVGNMPEWVFGWRLDRDEPTPGKYADRSREWTTYLTYLQLLAERYQCALQTDIVSFFASVQLDQLADRIQQLAGDNDVTGRLIGMLQQWGRIAGRTGLPQRCNASSILANMYLRPIDDVIREFGANRKARELIGSDVSALRWMDDVMIFADDPGHLRHAQMEMQSVLHGLGMHISPSKTMLLQGDELVDAAHEIEHSAVDQALSELPPETRPLVDLLSELVADPEMASATSIRFATVRMRAHELFDQVRDLVDVCPRMPHGSPFLGRLFRDSSWWQQLDGWYRDYERSEWGSIDWSVAQFGTMFPTHWRRPREPVVDVLTSGLDRMCSIPLFALAAQRMASWRTDNARRLFREVIRRTGDPHFRRVLALAGLNAGEEVSWIRSVLSEFEENAVTRAYLQSTGFAPVPISADFEADIDE
jgi:hypothetical protein